MPLEKYFKTLNNLIIGTTGTKLLEFFAIFQSWQNNGVKIWVFDVKGDFQIYKVIPDIDFTDEVIVQCYVLVVKILL